jgi:triacylglycerol esterase/lipase EstA (alpha/beta hydrolase family)
MRAHRLAILVVLVALLALAPIARGAVAYAPVNRPGPPLDVPTSQLASALTCTASVAHASREPVLLVPGTELTPSPNFSWNYERALSAAGYPYCAVTLPAHATGDIQVAGEYVVYAIRQMHASSGRKVQIVGYSQGGMVPRWALRFWPDTRAMVDDDIGLDASNHGTLDADYCQAANLCSAAFWQQRDDSPFIAALNSAQETFSGISYTEIYSNTDEVVVPNLGPAASSAVQGGGGAITDVAVQTVCPTDVSEHLAMGTYDPVGYALALDALTHAGPAAPGRVNRGVCATPFMPGVNPATFATNYAGYVAYIGASAAASKELPAEPPLRCYVFAAGCTSARSAPARDQ